jgi:RNA polymerase sigma factor (sigma-70 family)
MNTDRFQDPDPATGDQAATPSLADLFVGQMGQLKRVVAGMGVAAVDAEDVLQDVFVAASKHPDRFGSPEDAGRWLMRVTVNRCLSEFRRRKAFQKAARELQRRQEGSGPPSPDDAASRRDELAAVQEALAELDESLLSPLVLKYFCGLDSAQTGEILGLPPSTVRSRLRDGRIILAKRLMKRGVGP